MHTLHDVIWAKIADSACPASMSIQPNMWPQVALRRETDGLGAVPTAIALLSNSTVSPRFLYSWLPRKAGQRILVVLRVS